MLYETLRQGFRKGFPKAFRWNLKLIGESTQRPSHRSEHRHIRVRQQKKEH
jgi:hypothetical protein